MWIAIDDDMLNRRKDFYPKSSDDMERAARCIPSSTMFIADYVVYSGKIKPGYTYFFKSRTGETGWRKNADPACEDCVALERAITELEESQDSLADDKWTLEKKITAAEDIISKVLALYKRYGCLTDEDESVKEEAKEWAEYMDDIERALS